FFMQRALGRDLGWFWHAWLFGNESVDHRVATVVTQGIRTRVTVAQDGQMPAPIVLDVKFAATGPAIRPMKNAVMLDATTARVTVPVDVWFDGRRQHTVELVFGGRRIEMVTLDAQGRFPDRVPADNRWPR
ncbi:MAG: M1 family peptidase, partial [Gemmatimonas sp.]|nr:M1 family peptidase [Gemmatimonas sp.]